MRRSYHEKLSIQSPGVDSLSNPIVCDQHHSVAFNEIALSDDDYLRKEAVRPGTETKTFGSSSVVRELATAAKGRGFDSHSC